MKKVVLIFLAVTMLWLCGCSGFNGNIVIGDMKGEGEHSSENAESSESVPAELQKYSGTWYGYGTDSTNAVTSGKDIVFSNATRFEFDGEVYVMISEDTAESLEDHDSMGKKECKVLLVFGRDSEGDLALDQYVVKKSDRKQISQDMYYYRQPSRQNYQDFIKGISSQQAAVEPESQKVGAPVYENYEKTTFEERYYILSGKRVGDGPQMQMNIESGELFDQWDLLLNDVYKYLRNIKDPDEFERIKQDEIRWIIEKEAAIDKTYKEYEGGSMAPLAANTTAIEYTKSRCAYLISLID